MENSWSRRCWVKYTLVVFIVGEKQKMHPEERMKQMERRVSTLTELSEEQREEAYRRYEVVRACVEDGVSQAEQSRASGIPLSTDSAMDQAVSRRWAVWIGPTTACGSREAAQSLPKR